MNPLPPAGTIQAGQASLFSGEFSMEGNIFLILLGILITIPTVMAMVERYNRFKD